MIDIVKRLSTANLAIIDTFLVVDDDDSDEFISACHEELLRRKANPQPKQEDSDEEV